ncbi:ABC transporter permease, partial [Staphylococcus aureus]
MKPYIQLVLFKQWLQYILLVTTIVIALVLIGIGYRVAHDNFKIPITIQDLDQTTAS